MIPLRGSVLVRVPTATVRYSDKFIKIKGIIPIVIISMNRYGCCSEIIIQKFNCNYFYNNEYPNSGHVIIIITTILGLDRVKIKNKKGFFN